MEKIAAPLIIIANYIMQIQMHKMEISIVNSNKLEPIINHEINQSDVYIKFKTFRKLEIFIL